MTEFSIKYPKLLFNVEKRFWNRYYLRLEVVTDSGIRCLNQKLKRDERARSNQIHELIRTAVRLIDPNVSDTALEELAEHAETWVRM